MPSLESTFNLLLIIFGFGVLIFVHELGHFIAAKWAGIRAQAFAIGMGPVVASYRSGVGLALGSTDRKTIEKTGKKADDLTDDELQSFGVSETEYSLRLLPLGGFVRMLGQDDANPTAASDDRRSYTRCPVPKRMVVVSAGVIMNIILAVAFFVWAFLVGVPFEAPIIGGTIEGLPASTALPGNASQFSITEPGLQRGDVVLSINGNNTEAFSDIMIAAAMSKRGEPVRLAVQREINGESRRLQFSIVPEMRGGLLAIGVVPARSTRLFAEFPKQQLDLTLESSGLAAAGVEPGMRMLSAGGEPVQTWQAFNEKVTESAGRAIETSWARVGPDGESIGEAIFAAAPVEPELDVLYYILDNARQPVLGLFGLLPLVDVAGVDEKSENKGVIQRGDVFLRVAGVEAPRYSDLPGIVHEHAGETIEAIVLRDSEEKTLSLKVNRKGRIGIHLGNSDLPFTAQPIEALAVPRKDDEPIDTMPSPIADKEVYPGSRIEAVNGRAIVDWPALREIMREETAEVFAAGEGANLTIDFELRAPNRPRASVQIELSAEDVARLHHLGWQTPLASAYFEPIQVVQTAHGNPLVAISMGFDRTSMAVKHVYLTIVRLFQRTVAVEQLRGPVGIVHLGVQVADRGFMYLVFLLAMISVNLAVINFLPLPIVDGGLFLFLIYEKIKGRPPSLAFQNIATVAGLLLIAALFLVVTYNDIARLIVGS